MARIVLNPAIQSISGNIAGFVYRRQPDGSVTLARISLPDPARQLSEAQAGQIQRFKEAAAGYKRLMENADMRAAYEQVLAGRGPMARLRATVIGDILKAPTINSLDVSNYRGAVGDTIRVLAEDNVGVARLALAIHDQTSGEDVETAEKVFALQQLASAVEWNYTATVDAPVGHAIQISVTAYDLAGNKIEATRPVQN